MTDRELKRLRALPRELEQRKRERLDAARRMDPNPIWAASLWNMQGAGGFPVEKNKYLEECQCEFSRLVQFIQGIADREIRRMAELYYLRGRTWQQVAWEFGWRDEGTPRKKMKKYLEHSENSDLPDLK